MHQTTTQPPLSRHSQFIPADIILKKFSKNLVYEPIMFLGEHANFTDKQTRYKAGCIFSATKMGVCYLDLQTKGELHLSFQELVSVSPYKKAKDTAESKWVAILERHFYHLPECLCHLAAVIGSKAPYIRWNLEDQILGFQTKTSNGPIPKKQDPHSNSVSGTDYVSKFRQWRSYFQELEQYV